MSNTLKFAPTPGETRRRDACYTPHNAFIFYYEHGKAVAYLEVCFDCFGTRASPKDEASDLDYVELAKIFAELKLPYGRTSDSD